MKAPALHFPLTAKAADRSALNGRTNQIPLSQEKPNNREHSLSFRKNCLEGVLKKG
ncbi:MAG: hypothetical protein LBG98_00725 [Puniceicoccales bacterium]|nr:hypothetical protein [Puniceicoccales bacterium]